MKLTAKISCTLLAIFVALLGSAWVILERGILPGFARLEAEQHVQDVRRVHASLDALAREMVARANDYANWDDTYNFLRGENPSYIADNFTDDWFANYGVDLLFFQDGEGRIAWGRNGAPDRSGFEDSREIYGDVRVAAARAGAIAERPATGVIWTRHGPLLYAARPATRTDGAGAPLGLVVVGRFLSTEALGEQTQLDLGFVNLRGAGGDPLVRAALNSLAASDRNEMSWQAGEHLQSLIVLRAADGRGVGAIEATRARAITALGHRSIMVAALLMAAVFALALFVVWVLLRHLVIARLHRLEKHLDGQSNDLAPVRAARSADEIGRLCDAYNALAGRVREALAGEHAAIAQREKEAAANRAKSDFLANMSHELRTPLNAILGYADLVSEEAGASGNASITRDMQRINGAASHLLHLINELLDLSKIEAGRMDVAAAPFDVAKLIGDVVDTVSPLAAKNGNRLNVEMAPNLAGACTDELRLRQCLLNILSNACKFTKDGAVTLLARRDVEFGRAILHFEVRDTGIGMNAEQMARVFAPFEQADATTTRRFGGTGLGLAITRKMMRLLGGVVAVTSAEGRGSTFVLRAPAQLPALALDDETDQARAAA